METRALQSVRMEIYRRFPALRGVRPRIQVVQPARPMPGGPAYLLTFQGQALAPGARIPLVVRVTVDPNGRILKITTSR